YSIVDYRTTSSNHNYVRPPVPSVKWNRTTTMERDDRMESKPERTMRSSS
ncbi:unnamed protein product, partial [Rotaria magnacalcarata]